jgi:hypothetical protein
LTITNGKCEQLNQRGEIRLYHLLGALISKISSVGDCKRRCR